MGTDFWLLESPLGSLGLPIKADKLNSPVGCCTEPKVRVSMVVMNHDDFQTQWRHIQMGQFCANIFLIQATLNYLWPRKFSKIWFLNVNNFHLSRVKIDPNWNHELILMQLLFWINKIKNLHQFSDNHFSKNGP